jgi:hypothetical protein
MILLQGFEPRGRYFDSLQVFLFGCLVAWFVGAPAGWVVRQLKGVPEGGSLVSRLFR